MKLTGACYQGGRNELLSLIFLEPYRLLATTDDSGGIIVWDLFQDKRGFLTYPALFRLVHEECAGTIFTQVRHLCFIENEFEENMQLGDGDE